MWKHYVHIYVFFLPRNTMCWQSVGRHVYMCAWVCLRVDGWAGRARPWIRVQTNWVINESDRAAVMGPTPKLLMHADQHWQPFVLEKWGSCHRDEETVFILKWKKVSLSFSLSFVFASFASSWFHTHANTFVLWIWAQQGSNQGEVGC